VTVHLLQTSAGSPNHSPAFTSIQDKIPQEEPGPGCPDFGQLVSVNEEYVTVNSGTCEDREPTNTTAGNSEPFRFSVVLSIQTVLGLKSFQIERFCQLR
jgi:hypothetical protein